MIPRISRHNEVICECLSYHWTPILDENKNIVEIKCCRCKAILKYPFGVEK